MLRPDLLDRLIDRVVALLRRVTAAPQADLQPVRVKADETQKLPWQR